MINTGIAVGGPFEGEILNSPADIFPVALPGDLSAPIDEATPNMDDTAEVFEYRHHMMAVADGDTFAMSDKYSFWVPLDETSPNELIVRYLIETHRERAELLALAEKAREVIDWLMPGVRHISVPDYAQLNEVCMGLCAVGKNRKSKG